MVGECGKVGWSMVVECWQRVGDKVVESVSHVSTRGNSGSGVWGCQTDPSNGRLMLIVVESTSEAKNVVEEREGVFHYLVF